MFQIEVTTTGPVKLASTTRSACRCGWATHCSTWPATGVKELSPGCTDGHGRGGPTNADEALWAELDEVPGSPAR